MRRKYRDVQSRARERMRECVLLVWRESAMTVACGLDDPRRTGKRTLPYIRGLMMYTTSDTQSLGVARGRTREVGGFTEEGDKALGKR